MQDKEMFTYFKGHASAFDELPGDAVWSKIESGLTKKPFLKGHSFLFVTCGLALLAGIMFYILTPKEQPATQPKTTQQIKQEIITIAAPEIAPAGKKNTAIADALIVTDTVKKIKFKVIQPKADVIAFKTIPVKDTIKQAHTPRIATIKIQNLTNRIIVTTAEKLNTEEFNTLIFDMTEQHKNQSGMVLIIKAAGHKPYRKTITPGSSGIDVLQTDSTIHFMHQNQAPKLSNGVIKFRIKKEKNTSDQDTLSSF